MTDEFLTVMEITDVLKVNKQTIRNWIDADLRPYRLGPTGRRVRVGRADYGRFIAARPPKTTPVARVAPPPVETTWDGVVPDPVLPSENTGSYGSPAGPATASAGSG